MGASCALEALSIGVGREKGGADESEAALPPTGRAGLLSYVLQNSRWAWRGSSSGPAGRRLQRAAFIDEDQP